MDHTYVDAKNLKNLEDLMCNLVSEIATLRTLRATQVRGIEIGIMKEDQMTTSSEIIAHLDNLIKFYFRLADSVSEVLPPEFSIEAVSKRLIAAHLKKARAIAKNLKSTTLPESS